jgi:hypothetical protein
MTPQSLIAGCAVLLALARADIAAAALAPNYERLRELGAILGSDDVMQKLNHEVVNGIEVTGGGGYRVWTARCSVTVKLVGTANVPAIPGPWQFTIQVGEPQCH